MSIQTLPLFCLTLSSLNVRRTERDADVAALAEDIAACGLKQNLVVIPAHYSTAETEDNFGDKFEVITGGRRYQALRLLADAGRIEPDHPVPVLVEARDAAQQTSLSENLHRVAMNPADEFEAFAAIVTQQRLELGEAEAVAYTAKRFGVTVRHVEQRLRLAALAPEILDALRTGTITLDSAKAYAGSTDHALQLKVFAEQAKSNWKPHVASVVRDALRQRSLSLNDRLVKFVGLDAYRAAGGRTETDLFMGTEGEERLLDVKLLEDLAKGKAEPLVAPRAKKDGFASGLLAAPGSDKWPPAPQGTERFIRYYQDKDPTKAELKKRVAVYGIGDDGLDLLGHFHTPKPAQPREERDWAAERAARHREHQIELRAAHMAVGPVNSGHLKGTALEGRAFWPLGHCAAVEQDADEAFVLVALQIRVPAADVEAQMATATLLVDEEAAAKAAQEAAKADAAGPAGDDEEFGAEVQDEEEAEA